MGFFNSFLPGMRRNHVHLLLAAAIASASSAAEAHREPGSDAVDAAGGDSGFPVERDPWRWPSSSASIWNAPIGAGAVYVPAWLASVAHVAIDEQILLRVSAAAPEREVHAPASWERRAGGTPRAPRAPPFAARPESIAPVSDPGPRFPLRIGPDRRHLVDERGAPFLYHADTAWMLFLKLTADEAYQYMTLRKAQGFTALQVQLTGFLGATNRAGELPFAGTPPQQDFSRPNEKFFAHVDRVIAEAEAMGLLLAVAPAWAGCCGEGWAGKSKNGSPGPIDANGAEATRELGRWLGRRYGKFENVMWILGGDNDPHSAREAIRALGRGLKDTAPGRLITYHAASSHSSTDVWPADEDWLDVSMVYTYFRGFDKAWNKRQPDVYEVSRAEYAKAPVRPFFLGESTYEGEHGAWGSALQARKQAYWCVLSGGCGHAYGSPDWDFPPNWREIVDLPGAASLKYLRALLESRPWWSLRPDGENAVAVDGRGPWGANDATITAVASDAAFAITYLPARRAVTIDLAKISGEAVAASWYDPRNGKTASAGRFAEKKRQTFAPPGEGDWILVLDDAGRGFPAPGTSPSQDRPPRRSP